MRPKQRVGAELWGGGLGGAHAAARGGRSRPAARAGGGASTQVSLGVSEGRQEVLGPPAPRGRVLLRRACTSEGSTGPVISFGPRGKGGSCP